VRSHPTATALAIADSQAKSDPSSAGWQRDLSVSYNKVAKVQVMQGDRAGALKSYSDSLATRKALVAKDGSNIQWQNDLQFAIRGLASFAGYRHLRPRIP
jgi:hypothetical protein